MHGMTGPLGAQTQQPLARRRDRGHSRAGSTRIAGTTDPLPRVRTSRRWAASATRYQRRLRRALTFRTGERATEGATEVRLRRHTVEWLSPENVNHLIATYGYIALGVIVALESMAAAPR
jgi:hypothetical protein